jgi:hypothetical protein
MLPISALATKVKLAGLQWNSVYPINRLVFELHVMHHKEETARNSER